MASGDPHIFRVFALGEVRPDSEVEVHAEDLRHVSVVLRGARSGLEVVDAAGGVYTARVDGKKIIAGELVQAPTPALAAIQLFVGGVTGSAWDATIDMATQAGVSGITCMASTQKELTRFASRGERSERVARAASRQSKRSILPSVAAPQLWTDLAVTPTALRILLEPGSVQSLLDVLSEFILGPADLPSGVAIAVGASDGIPAQVVERLVSDGWVCARLGETVMRTELAAACAVAITQMTLGDFHRRP